VHAAGSGACLRTLARREPGQRWRPHGALLAPERRLILWDPTDTVEVWDSQ
jgi:hypothetical protein